MEKKGNAGRRRAVEINLVVTLSKQLVSNVLEFKNELLG